MKIDLHCHTKKVKHGENNSRDVDIELFKKKILDANVKIVAITNHNLFDLEQYVSFSKAVEQYCKIWPGIEFDVKGTEGKKWHLIVIFDPKEYTIFNTLVKTLIDNKSPDTCILSLEEIVKIFSNKNCIYIPHYHKEPSISDIELKHLQDLVKDNSRIFSEVPNFRSLGVFANYNYNVMIGSDVQDWDNYEKNNFAELRLPVSTFEQFCLLSKRDTTIVDSLLNKKSPINICASPVDNVNITLRFYNEVNIICGQKGTGKSKILESIRKHFQQNGNSVVYYKGTQKETDFDNILKVSDTTRKSKVLLFDPCQEEFLLLKNWEDTIPTKTLSYINWITTKDDNQNKRRMLITNASDLQSNSAKNLETSKKNYANIKKICSDLFSFPINLYLTKKESIRLKDLLLKLKKQALYEFYKKDINQRAIYLTNKSLKLIKKTADKNTDTVSKPSTAGFYYFASKHLLLLKATNKILSNFSIDKKFKEEYFGNLEDKGQIFIRTEFSIMNDKSKPASLVKKKTILAAIKKNLLSLQKQWYSDTIIQQLILFNSTCNDNDIVSVSDFLSVEKFITLNDKPYMPSSGEKGILLLEHILNEEADAYLLDEPELGMGNSYIDSSIRPKLSALGKAGKMVIVVTHNANIAVRTLPYSTIFRVHKNGNYCTYLGNPFIDKLTNIDNPNDQLSWTKESMHILEGGEKAFYERKNIYETGNH